MNETTDTAAPKKLGCAAGLVLSAFLLLAAAGMVEIGVRVLRLAPPPQQAGDGASLQRLIEFDPVVETRYRPNTSGNVRSQYNEFEIAYQINGLGLRDRPLEEGGPPRVLFLGNSYVEGWAAPAEQTFLAIAEKEVQPPRRLVNAGMSGFGAAQCRLFLLDLLPKVKPQAVVAVLVGTMAYADHSYLKRAKRDDTGLALGLDPAAILAGGQREAAGGPPGFLERYTHLGRLVGSRIRAAQARNAIRPGDPQSDLFAVYRAEAAARPKLLEPVLVHLEGMAAAAGKAGVPFACVYLPMPFQVSPTAWSAGRKVYNIPAGILPDDDRALVAEFCKARSIACHLPHQTLRQAAKDENLYFDYDFHFNARGNAVMGKWLAGVVSGLPPADAASR